LFLLSIETGEKRRLTSPPAQSFGDGDPAFSPDGRTLVFGRFVAYCLDDLYLLPLLGDLKPAGEPKRLTFDIRGISRPVWTLDGREIIFSSDPGCSGRSSLWRMPASGAGGPRQASFGEDGYSPAISHQGNRRAYVRWTAADEDIWRMEMPGPHGPPSSTTDFISSTREEAGPQYSPDGKKIAFVSARSGREEVWLCDSDGSNACR